MKIGFLAVLRGVAAGVCLVLAGLVPIKTVAHTATVVDAERLSRRIIVAIEDKPDPVMTTGASARGYVGPANYSGSQRSRADAARLAREHGLVEVSAWTITALGWRCMLYEIDANADREQVLAELASDGRVRLAQPLQGFETLTSTSAEAPQAPFNDPYLALQTGFAAIAAGSAQQLSRGENVRVAVIDTGIDIQHPDLAGQVRATQDLVGIEGARPATERHGTEVAGVIAAIANNGLGIVGVAPAVDLRGYRACWPMANGSAAARCNSFTLAKAIAAAIRDRAQVINLSLGGPHDPLLSALLEHAMDAGAIVVGAVDTRAAKAGFPVDTQGVIAITDAHAATQASQTVLRAPGTDILTLEPGGSFDYASGSSLATAHVSGIAALLLQVAPRIGSDEVFTFLRDSSDADGSVNACRAVRAASKGAIDCAHHQGAAPRQHAMP